MRKNRKMLALLLAMILGLGLTSTAFASDAKGYTDVPDWAKEYIDRVTELGLIDGKTATTFAPSENMTRADLVTALYRLAGKPAVSGVSNPFTDVADSAAYQDAVLWANSKNIVNGKTTDTFAPAGEVTRQEIAKILNGYAAAAKDQKSLSNRIDVLSSYPDASDVSSWAKDVMNWAVASEFITGTSDGKLNPKGTATRAQVAAIICRYLDDNATGDASKDNPRNQDNIGENELLVVSFGTSFNDNRAATIGAIESAMEKAFSDYSVRRGFTANIIIEHVVRRDGEVIDDVEEALDRAKANGVKNLLVQPTHLMNGYEYGDLVKELESRASDFETVKIGAPLLTTDEDFAVVAKAMVDATASLADEKTAVCYMGHGTEAASNGIYSKMQTLLTEGGNTNYFVGTVEAAPTAEDLVKLVKEGGYEKVILRPMMIVAGDHANNDMAGDEEDSWKSIFTAAGFEVQCEVKGLGELTAVQDLLVAHAKDAKTLGETGINVEPNPENGKADAAPAEPAGDAGAKTLADGVYSIEAASDSKMFRVTACTLTVKDGKMTAVITLGGTGYDQMYVGTKAEAEKASEGLIDYVADAEGAYTFTVPVEALDTELAYAAHAVKSGNWFDRVLTFDSSTAAAK